MTTATLTPESARSGTVTDFSESFDNFTDRLPAVLILEAKQGLRGWVFVAIFLALLVSLVGQASLETINASLTNPFDQEVVESTRSLLVIIFLVVLPFRALHAVSFEQRDGTLDMLRLSNLSAYGICFGKWLSLATQTALLISILLPFTIIRYFLSRVDVVGEVAMILLLFVLSLVLQAGVLAASSIRPWFAKSLIFFVFALVALSGFSAPVWATFGPIVAVVVWGLTYGLILTALSIDLSALTVEPASRSRATLRLIVPVIMFVLSVVLAFTQVVNGCSLAMPFIAVTALAVANSLLEGNARLDRWVATPTRYIAAHQQRHTRARPTPSP